MQDFTRLNIDELVDKLSQHMAKYTQILKEGGTDAEYVECKLSIAAIQQEIERRRSELSSASAHQSREVTP